MPPLYIFYCWAVWLVINIIKMVISIICTLNDLSRYHWSVPLLSRGLPSLQEAKIVNIFSPSIWNLTYNSTVNEVLGDVQCASEYFCVITLGFKNKRISTKYCCLLLEFSYILCILKYRTTLHVRRPTFHICKFFRIPIQNMFNLCVIIRWRLVFQMMNYEKILGLHLDKCSMYVHVHAVIS